MTNAIHRLINNASNHLNHARSTLDPTLQNEDFVKIERCLDEIETLIAEPTEPAKPAVPIKPFSSTAPMDGHTCTNLEDIGFYIRNFGNAIKNTDLQQTGAYIIDWSNEQRERNTKAMYAARTQAQQSPMVVDFIDGRKTTIPASEKYLNDVATISDVHTLINVARAKIDIQISKAMLQQEKNVERTVIAVRNAMLNSLDKAFKRT